MAGEARQSRALDVLRVSADGLTSFGGPIAHLGYFRDEYVVRRKWLDEATDADLGLAANAPAQATLRCCPNRRWSFP